MSEAGHSGFQIAIGMRELDYYSLLDRCNCKGKIEWTCHEKTQVGDRVFFYFGKKLKKIVATGKILEPRWETGETRSPAWRYRTTIGHLRVIQPIPLVLIRHKVPDMGWTKQPRSHKVLSVHQAAALMKLVDSQMVLAQNGLSTKHIPRDWLSEELVGQDGENLKRLINHRKREIRLRKAKIDQATSLNNGKLRCEIVACGFEFAKVYGELGHGYAHVHHLSPLASLDGPKPTRLEDLAVVCPNCHAMLHRRNPPLTIAELNMRMNMLQ